MMQSTMILQGSMDVIISYGHDHDRWERRLLLALPLSAPRMMGLVMLAKCSSRCIHILH